jgi:hypothetical protein
MIFQLSWSKGDCIKLAVFVHLSEYGPEASGGVGGARGGIRDKGILAV